MDEQTQVVTLTREELDDALEAAVMRGRQEPADLVHEAGSLVDDILDKIKNPHLIYGFVLLWEVWNGHMNRVLDLIRLFLTANPGGV